MASARQSSAGREEAGLEVQGRPRYKGVLGQPKTGERERRGEEEEGRRRGEETAGEAARG